VPFHRFWRIAGQRPGRADLVEFHELDSEADLQQVLAEMEARPNVARAVSRQVKEQTFVRETGRAL